MSCQVLGCSTDGDARFKDLQTDFAPRSDGFEVDTAVDEGLRQISSPCAEGVGTNSDGTGCLVGFEELDSLGGGEEFEELLGKEGVVSVVGANVGQKLLDVFRARSTVDSELLEVGKDGDDLLDSHVDELKVGTTHLFGFALFQCWEHEFVALDVASFFLPVHLILIVVELDFVVIEFNLVTFLAFESLLIIAEIKLVTKLFLVILFELEILTVRSFLSVDLFFLIVGIERKALALEKFLETLCFSKRLLALPICELSVLGNPSAANGSSSSSSASSSSSNSISSSSSSSSCSSSSRSSSSSSSSSTSTGAAFAFAFPFALIFVDPEALVALDAAAGALAGAPGAAVLTFFAGAADSCALRLPLLAAAADFGSTNG